MNIFITFLIGASHSTFNGILLIDNYTVFIENTVQYSSMHKMFTANTGSYVLF